MKTVIMRSYGYANTDGGIASVIFFEGETLYRDFHESNEDLVEQRRGNIQRYVLHLDRCETGEMTITSIVDEKGRSLKSLIFSGSGDHHYQTHPFSNGKFQSELKTVVEPGHVLRIGDCFKDKLGLAYDPFGPVALPEAGFGNDPDRSLEAPSGF